MDLKPAFLALRPTPERLPAAKPSLGFADLPVVHQEAILDHLTPRELSCLAASCRGMSKLVDGLRAPHPAALAHGPPPRRGGRIDFRQLASDRAGVEARLDEQLDPQNIVVFYECAEVAANLLPVRSDTELTRETIDDATLWLDRPERLQRGRLPDAHQAARAIAAYHRASAAWRSQDVGLANIAMALSVTYQFDDAAHYAGRLVALWQTSAAGSRQHRLRTDLLRWVLRALVAPDLVAALGGRFGAQGLVDPTCALCSAAVGGNWTQFAWALEQCVSREQREQAVSAALGALVEGSVITADTGRILTSCRAQATREHVLRAANLGNVEIIRALHRAGVALPCLAEAMRLSCFDPTCVALANLWLDVSEPLSAAACADALVLALRAGDGALVQRLEQLGARLPEGREVDHRA
ncbi:MAG: hypothetical protein EOO40_04275, partial [Deltaproteobacteria bacterium]